MSTHKEVSKLLNKMSGNSGSSQSSATRFEHYLLPDIDVAPHKRAKAYPGKEYMLMGNSFNLEPDQHADKRAAALHGLFCRSNGGTCKLADALKSDEFNQVLSRFERDWLARLTEDTVIGPAFDENARALPDAFAVWRPINRVLRSKTLAPV